MKILWRRRNRLGASRSGVGIPLPYVAEGKVYLDWNATSPIFPEVTAAALPFLSRNFGNPSSDHCFGAPCRDAVSISRLQLASLIGCGDDEVVFTGCGSEADNMAIRGAVRLGKTGFANKELVPHIVTSAIEHPAITACIRDLEELGEATATFVPVEADGRVRPEAVAAAVKETTVLVTIMHSNNEVGSVMDIATISALVRGKSTEAQRRLGLPLIHTDAAQSIGKVKVKVHELGCDLLTLVGHKFGAPKGIAALYVRRDVQLPSLLYGGGQEGGRRAGTESVPLIVAMGAASRVVDWELEAINSHMRQMIDRLYRGLVTALKQHTLRVNGPPLNAGDGLRLPNTLSLGISGAKASELLAKLTASDIAASASAACHSADTAQDSISFVLVAMRVPDEFAKGTLRLSVGRHTSSKEVDRAVSVIAEHLSSCVEI